jgi:hypothetical protein
MATILIEILRSPADRQLPAEAYYVLLDFPPNSFEATITADSERAALSRRSLSSMVNRTVEPYLTPESAIEEAQRKLRVSLLPGDVIEFNGGQYNGVDAAMQAMKQAHLQWA